MTEMDKLQRQVKDIKCVQCRKLYSLILEREAAWRLPPTFAEMSKEIRKPRIDVEMYLLELEAQGFLRRVPGTISIKLEARGNYERRTDQHSYS